jgi:hypothetical protein
VVSDVINNDQKIQTEARENKFHSSGNVDPDNPQESDSRDNGKACDQTGQYLVCVPDSTRVSDGNTEEESKGQAISQNGRGDYFVLEKSF